MEEPKTTQIIDAIEEGLKRIRAGDVYRTSLGREVFRGFWSHALKSKDRSFPLIAIQPGSEGGTTKRDGKAEVIPSTIWLIIAAKATDDEATDTLRSCLADVRKSIKATEKRIGRDLLESNIALGEAEYTDEASSSHVLAALPVSFTFVEIYEDLENA